MAIEIKETEYENFGRCVKISNGIIEVLVTIDVGPRIIYFGFVGEQNMLYADLERKCARHNEQFDSLYGKGTTFYNYGGHRLWLSPESSPATHYPDNDPVIYSILPDGVSFTPAQQKHNQMQLAFEVMMYENASDIMIIHSATNHSKEEHLMALWSVTMMKPGGIEIIPQNPEVEHLLPSRVLVLWPYSKMADPRVFWGDRYVTLSYPHPMGPDSQFKYGTDNTQGWAAYLQGNTALVKRYVHNAEAAYPDCGASYETFICDDFLEMETLSPLCSIRPNETVRHVENWSLFRSDFTPSPTDEAQIQECIDKLH